MDKFGIIISKANNGKLWIDEQPFESIKDIVDWIYTMQIDDPNTIHSIIWMDADGRWSNITAIVAELVWEIYDGTNEYCHKQTLEWFQSFKLPCDDLNTMHNDR